METTFDVLGPLRVRDRNGVDHTPNGVLGRRLLAALLLQRGAVVPPARLVDTVWGEETVPNGPAALHSHVFRLRKRIPGLPVTHEPGGYRLAVLEATIDANRFEALVSEAKVLAPNQPAVALQRFDDALACWRGRPYAELEDTDDGRIEIERLCELHRSASEERLAVLLTLGRAGDAAAELAALVAREPLRERPRLLLMDALAACGRRAEALRVYDAYRLALAAELGVAPSPVIRARHEALLALDDVHAADVAHDDRDNAAAPAAAAVRLGLPPRPISSFVGRQRELDELDRRLRAWRLVTVLGPGGVGKTRLTVELVHRVADRFAGGVLYCDLTTVDAGLPRTSRPL
ncbi:MAG: BTAD domain-containing putative transcriptional regulator [Acidimicrobiales bacterium]